MDNPPVATHPLGPISHSLGGLAEPAPAMKIDTEHPTGVCVACNYEMQASTCVTPGRQSAEPRPGDLSVCLNCGQWLEFNDILVPKPISETTNAGLTPRERELMNRTTTLIHKRGRFWPRRRP